MVSGKRIQWICKVSIYKEGYYQEIQHVLMVNKEGIKVSNYLPE